MISDWSFSLTFWLIAANILAFFYNWKSVFLYILFRFGHYLNLNFLLALFKYCRKGYFIIFDVVGYCISRFWNLDNFNTSLALEPIFIFCLYLLSVLFSQVTNIKKTLKSTQQQDMEEQMVTDSRGDLPSGSDKPVKKTSKTKG